MPGNAKSEASKQRYQIFANLAVAFNYEMYAMSRTHEIQYLDPKPGGETARLIEKVGSSKDKLKKFRRILEKLPSEATPESYAAHIVRAFSGLQLFPDANHRTGFFIASMFLASHGFKLTIRPAQFATLIDELKDPKGNYYSRCTLDKVGTTDPPYQRCLEMFEPNVVKMRWLERRRFRKDPNLAVAKFLSEFGR